MRLTVLFTIVLVSIGCATHHGAPTPRAESLAVYMTGYDVPKPSEIPFADEPARREYLRFYHFAYLATMWEDVPSLSCITPISDAPEAAVAGHYAGEVDAHRDKSEYWRQRGREYEFVHVDPATGAVSWHPLRVLSR